MHISKSEIGYINNNTGIGDWAETGILLGKPRHMFILMIYSQLWSKR